MHRSQAEITRQLLIDFGVGVAGAYTANVYTGSPWPVFQTSEPDTPDNCITITDTTGMVDNRDMFGTINEHLGLQIRVRSFGHNIGLQRINTIRTAMALMNTRTVAIGAGRYFVQAYSRIGSVLVLGLEVPTSKRSLFTFNAVAAMRQL